MQTKTSSEEFMDIALDLARRGLGRTSPNPMVGAVVVSDGRVVGEGWYEGPGSEHAEVVALQQAGNSARGATVFVNLEPCAHTATTGPCADALIESGVSKVVASSTDPDSRTEGSGFEALRRHSVVVETGVRAAEATDLNRAYIVHRTQSRPFVTYKAALSLDGKVSSGNGGSRWISTEDSRLDAHHLRAVSDAIAVGVGTVMADDPSLTVRGVARSSPLLRVIFDSRARVPKDSKVLNADAPTLIFVGENAPKGRISGLRSKGAEVIVAASVDGRVDIPTALKQLADAGIISLLLEGGPTLSGAFLQSKCVDCLRFYIAPKLLGDAPALGPIGSWVANDMDSAIDLDITSVEKVGADVRVEALMKSRA